jgi:rubrerythrin
MASECIHSCKGLCSALEIAEHRESEALKEYRKFRETCDYPDVRDLLGELIGERERALKLLREKRLMLDARFRTLDSITESFL